MEWFEEQIKQREKNDGQAFSGTFNDIEGAILGKHKVISDDRRAIANSVIDEILNYYNIDFDPEEGEKRNKSAFLLDEEEKDPLEEIEEQLHTRLEPRGILFRHAKLDKGWEKSAIGPMICVYGDGQPAALIPNKIKGYTFRDVMTGERIKVKGRIADEIKEDVICFYEPLPAKELSYSDLLKFAFKSVSAADVIMSVLMVMITAAFDVILPIASNYIFTDIVDSKNISALIAVGIALICVSISTIMIDCIKMFVGTRIGTKQSVAVDGAVMMRVLSMPAPFFRSFSSGELTKRVEYVSGLCNDVISLVLDVALTFIFSFIQIFAMALYAPSLIWIAILVMAANLIFSAVTLFVQQKHEKKLMAETAKEYGVGYALMSGIQKIKLAGAEKRAFAKWGKHYAKKAEYMYNPALLLKINGVVSTVIAFAGMIAIYAAAYASGISPADYYSFNASFAIFSATFVMFAEAAAIISSIKSTGELIEPILKTVPENSSTKEIVTSLNGRIEMAHVSFSYGEKLPNVINDLSLSVKSGEYVAIVGTTGCGKSTLIRLLLGFERPVSGSIYYDNYDINTVDIRSLRRKIGSVTQSGRLLSGSIYSNIVLNAPQIGIEGAWDAAELADIAEDIKRLPMGMHTVISEGGGGLSGGQKQRIMIARALASNPRILIFDEATSALDNVAQKKVSEAIDKLNCTRIVIAHRLSTIKNCDRILVLDRGRIIEEGTYDSLIEQNGFFAKLVERQRLDK